ncbi:MAG: 1-phosphofructokinase [Uliginosibacterium sp.]|nr:1-phosphofructokinase [Uliginosibacterium sp.]
MSTACSASLRPSVACVALNPALDQTIDVRNLRLGEVNRAQRAQIDVGGKGINVASCLADYCGGVAVTGLLGRDNLALFEQLFDRKAILNHCLYVDGMTRINTKLVDPAQGMTTDINMPGPELSAEQISAAIEGLCRVIDELAQSVTWFVLSGSLPPGWPDDTYARLISRVRGHGRKVLLDASGLPLLEGLRAQPHVLKPNENELSELVGRKLRTPGDIRLAVQELLAANTQVECVAVSMGGDGALFFSRTESLHAQALPVELISTVGAGDAMVAGLVAAQIERLPLAASAQLATAFSAAKLSRLGPHLPGVEVVRQRMMEVRVKTLEAA